MSFIRMIRFNWCQSSQLRYMLVSSSSLFLLIAIILQVFLPVTQAVPPNFVTTFTDDVNSNIKYESGSVVLSTSSPATSNGFDSQSTTITFANTYGSQPQFAYGYTFINANWQTTTLAIETIIDLSMGSGTTTSQVLIANFTQNTVSQISINYIASTVSGFFIDITHTYSDLTSTSLFSSSVNSVRTADLNFNYETKSNSSNAVAFITTTGLSMMRQSNTFQYALDITAQGLYFLTATLTLQNYNGMRFIRVCVVNYESVVNVVESPKFLSMDMVDGMSGTVADNSGISGVTVFGSPFVGMTHWTLSDSTAVLKLNIARTDLSYTIEAGSVTNARTVYVWYREAQCPTSYYNHSLHDCQPCDYTCHMCTGSTNTSCSSCDASDFRTFLASNSSCPCNNNYKDVGNSICQAVVCPTDTCVTCSDDNFCIECISGQLRTLVNGTCTCSDYTIDLSANALYNCNPCFPTCLSCSFAFSQTACLTCDLNRDHRTFQSATNTCQCVEGYYQIPNLAATFGSYLNKGAPCLQCQYSCEACTSDTACSSCKTSVGRVANATTGFCSCDTGYYDDLLNQECLSCPLSCDTCSSNTTCESCPSTRTLTNGSCPCSIAHYQVNAKDCLACDYRCQSCSDNTTCDTCSSTNFRTLVNSTCECVSGYFGVDLIQACTACHVTCASCTSDSLLACTQCDSADFRQLSLNNTCTCVQGYFQIDSSTAKCGTCHYTCQGCSSAADQCVSCNATMQRALTNVSCLCADNYYDDGGNQQCASCLYFCLTCTNGSLCQTCDNTTRNTSDLSLCACLDTFYDNGSSSSCQPCHPSCSKCTNGVNCTQCPSDRTFTASHSCSCLSGTFQPDCYPCLYSCDTCNDNTSCSTCNATAYREFNASSTMCQCRDGYYDDNSSQLCLSCHYSCLTCSDSTACVDCLTNRAIDSNTSYCSCVDKYYEHSTNLNCVACHYSCATCSDYSQCTNCSSSNFREAVNSTTLCQCMQYYYDNGITEECIACHVSCLSCSLVSTNCTSCDSNNSRTLTNNTCPCDDGFYDNGAAICQACHYSCDKCSDSSSCSGCNSTAERVYVSGPYCECNPGFYDMTNQQLCPNCDYTCKTCTTTSTLCLDCVATRTHDNSTNTCPCSTGFYDLGATTCLSCLYHCLTCSNSSTCTDCPSTRLLDSSLQCNCINSYYDVNGTQDCQACSPVCHLCSDFDVCTLCDTTNNFRELVNSTCICPNGYFDLSGSGNYTCQSCHYSCQACSSASQCTSCDSSSHRISNSSSTLCLCASGYYDDGTNQACILCPYDCLTCSNATTCLECSSTRQLGNDSRCSCLSTYFQNGTLCEACPVQCTTCQSSSNCTGCPTNRTLNSGACQCNIGLYSLSGTANCAECLYSCESCVTALKCATCNSTHNRYLSFGSCLCSAGFYDDNSTSQCQSCHYSCQLCNAADSCLSCASSSNRIYNSTSQLCECASGYYESNQTCVQCPFNCLTCSDGSTCTQCNTNTQRTLNLTTNLCDCPTVGYYDTLTSQICGTCHYTCHTCVISSTQCTDCLNTTFRSLSGDTCPCSDGYYDVTNQEICSTCHYRCLTCETTSLTCTQCPTSAHRNSTPDCACLDGYYDNGQDTLCATCDYSCQACANAGTCSACNDTVAFRQLSNATNKCECMQYYFDSGITQCQSCHYTCDSCQHNTECLTCPNTTRSLSGTSCVCLEKYYDDGSSRQCQSCLYSCQACTASNSCFSCNSTMKREYNSTDSMCVCTSGFYDNESDELCATCEASCFSCSNGTACDTCPPNINKTINTTTGSNFCVCEYGYIENVAAGVALGYSSVCEPCQTNCLNCQNSTTICTVCVDTFWLFTYNDSHTLCIQTCPDIYYQLNLSCVNCKSPCLACTAEFTCTSCVDGYYLHNSSCYLCQSSCSACNGPSALDCTTCITNYSLVAGVCQILRCNSSQYAESTLGCTQCTVSFANSLTCLATGPVNCQDGYILSNNTCSSCSSVTGYSLNPTTNTCEDLCGDGTIITDSCDDGNTLNGDGCSSYCKVERGWTCSGAGTCSLSSTPTLSLNSIKNYPLKREIRIVLELSVGLRLLAANFRVTFGRMTRYSFTVNKIDRYFKQFQIVISYNESPQGDQLSVQIVSPATRLLISSQTASRQLSTTLSISLSLNLDATIDTQPPAIYVSEGQSKVYQLYLRATLGFLHLVLIICIIIALVMGLKVMLLAIDAFNALTITYILTGLALNNITLVSSQAVKGLQPFVYPFGSTLADESTNFHNMNYTQTFFSSAGLQSIIILIVGILWLVSPTDSDWSYYKSGFIFAFSYDIMLACSSIFVWSQYTSYESSYSWMLAVLASIVLFGDTIIYYNFAEGRGGAGRKVLPAVSFITNEYDNKDKGKGEIGMFELNDDSRAQKQVRGVLSQDSELRTQVLNVGKEEILQPSRFYDLTPSVQTQLSMPNSNHISRLHLPITCTLFGLLLTISCNIQNIVARMSLLVAITFLYLVFFCALRAQSMSSVRSVKLFLNCVIYLLMAIVGLVAAVKGSDLDLLTIDKVIVALALLAAVGNIITFILNVCKSESYRQYQVNKRNNELMEKARKQHQTRQTRQKLYTRNDTKLSLNYKEPEYNSKLKEPDFNSLQQANLPNIFDQPQIQISEQAEEKNLRISAIRKKRDPSVHNNSQTRHIMERDPSIVQMNMRIDDEISDIGELDRKPLEKTSLKPSQISSISKIKSARVDAKMESVGSPSHAQSNAQSQSQVQSQIHSQAPPSSHALHTPGSRIKAINSSEASLGSRFDGVSMFLDRTLQPVEEKKEVHPKQKSPKKKRRMPQRRQVKMLDSQDDRAIRKDESSGIQDMLEEMQMPRGFKAEQVHDVFPQRALAMDQISSIREERQQFIEQDLGNKELDSPSVFNKILEDYKKYKDKKVDRKKLRKMKKKQEWN